MSVMRPLCLGLVLTAIAFHSFWHDLPIRRNRQDHVL